MSNVTKSSSTSIEQVVVGSSAFTALCEKHISKSKLWNDKRLYIYGVGYKTKKAEQKLYIDLFTFTLKGETICNSQPDSWCRSQTEELLDNPRLQAFARLLRILCAEKKAPVTTEEAVAAIVQDAILESQDVVGYVTEWRNVRVSINRFGKLGSANRQFLIFKKTTKNQAGRGFVEISEIEFEAAKSYFRSGETMMEPYTEASYYIGLALRMYEKDLQSKSIITNN